MEAAVFSETLVTTQYQNVRFFIKGEEFPEYLSDYQLLKVGYSLWDWLGPQ
jgi:hypothetical protein